MSIRGQKIDLKIIAGIVIILIVAAYGSGFFRSGAAIPHGYDGIVSEIVDIDHIYNPQTTVTLGDYYYKGINPQGWWVGISAINPTGIKMTVTSPQHIKTTDLTPLRTTELVTINNVIYNRTVSLQRSIVDFEMSATVKTYEGSFDGMPSDASAIHNVKFWIKLKNNDYTIFSDPDDVAVAIISVVTDGLPVKSQVGLELEFFPDAGGQDLPLYSLTGSEVSGFQIPTTADINVDNFNKLREIRFPIDIIVATPIAAGLFNSRVDCQATWKFKIVVVLIGQWTTLRPWIEYEEPEPEITLWQILAESLTEMFAWLGEFLSNPLTLVVIAIIVIVILIIFLKVFSLKSEAMGMGMNMVRMTRYNRRI